MPQFVLGIAGHPLETFVRRQIASELKIERCDADWSGLEHGSPTLFTRAQRRFRPLAIGDVDGHYAKESRRAIRRGNEKRIHVGPYDLTVPATVTLFNPIASIRTSGDVINERSRRCPIVLVSNIERLQISQLVLGIAGHQLETLIRRQISVV